MSETSIIGSRRMEEVPQNNGFVDDDEEDEIDIDGEFEEEEEEFNNDNDFVSK
jgi:hypothetical protein